jgi:signal transduction histidine kinase
VNRLIPASLIGRIALVMALALLAAQAINFALVRSERQRLSQTQLEGPVITRFVGAAARLVERERERPIETRRGRIAWGDASPIDAQGNDAELAGRLRDIALANGLPVREARAAISDSLPPLPPPREGARARGPEMLEQRQERFRSLLLSAQLEDGRWVNGQMLILRPANGPLLRLAGATALIYFALLAAMMLVVARLVRPLRDLTAAAARFRGRGETVHVEPRGPLDIRRAIEAFNAMGARVGAMIDEKDRMLGAIGHDLRTPLASLRIRAESVEPAEERERMIATIEEMASLLDDTLELARSGRSSESARPVDLGALVDAVVEEFRALGHDVTFSGAERAVATVRPNLIRRAVRNLIDNAVQYAGAAAVALSTHADCATIEVLDRGPGIPPDRLSGVQEPFVRLEGSRSRATGGTGLGLTLARAAAQLHGGDLLLANREEGGLSARISLVLKAG